MRKMRQSAIGGFNQRQGAVPPQIFLTLKFVVWAKLQNYRNCCHLMSDFKAKKYQIRFQRPLRSQADPIPALGPPGLETTCLPKYLPINPPMQSAKYAAIAYSRFSDMPS